MSKPALRKLYKSQRRKSYQGRIYSQENSEVWSVLGHNPPQFFTGRELYMDKQRGFKCQVKGGAYSNEVTVWVDTESIETYGDYAIRITAWREWRRQFGLSVGMGATEVKILEEIGG